MVWEKILERPRILRIHPAESTPTAGNTSAEAKIGYHVLMYTRRLHSKLLRVNRESRQVALKFFRARIARVFVKNGMDRSSLSTAQEGCIVFCPDYDFLHVTSVYDLKTTYDPHQVGLRNLATD